MSSLCENHCRKDRGSLIIEIRHFETIRSEIHYEDNNDCSVCFLDNVNKHTEKPQEHLCNDYFDPPTVYSIIIPKPHDHEELHKLLAEVIPIHYGPGLLERLDGSAISPDSCTFVDGEKIIFREIRPCTKKDFDMKRLYGKFKELDIEYYESFPSNKLLP